MFFHLCEVVQIFQRESIFCNKISSGRSLFIKKLVPGGTNFEGSIFTMTGPGDYPGGQARVKDGVLTGFSGGAAEITKRKNSEIQRPPK